MTTTAYATLRGLGSPLVTTAEAAAALRVSTSAASRALRALARRGLVQGIRYGLWSLASEPADPRRLATEITRPYPAYVSFESALSAHGMIDQLPRDITLASLDRAKLVKTIVASYAVHHLAPALFGGFEERNGVPLATPEKALFDYVYVALASAHPRRRLPEVELPEGFSWRAVQEWVGRIRFDALRRRVDRALRDTVQRAGGEVVLPTRHRRTSTPSHPSSARSRRVRSGRAGTSASG